MAPRYDLPFSRSDYTPKNPHKKKRKAGKRKAGKRKAGKRRATKGKMPAAALKGLRKYRAKQKAKKARKTAKRAPRAATAATAPAKKRRTLSAASKYKMRAGRNRKSLLKRKISMKSWLAMDPEARFEAQQELGTNQRVSRAATDWVNSRSRGGAPNVNVIVTPAPQPRNRGLMLAADNRRIMASRRPSVRRARARPRSSFRGFPRGVGMSRQMELDYNRATMKPPVKAGSSKRRKKANPGYFANPVYFPRPDASRGGRPAKRSWWIADVYKGTKRRPIVYISQSSKTDAHRGAMQLLTRHRAKSVELSGPYTRQPTPATARK